MSNSQARWIDAGLREYEAHRAEVLAEASAQQQILALGATAVGVVVAGAFNVWDDHLLATIAFLGVVPLLTVFVLVQWAGRAAAMMRVGRYLEALETALCAELGSPFPLLRWEATLARLRPASFFRPRAGWNDFGAVAVFALIGAGSLALGAYRGWSDATLVVFLATLVQSAVLIGTVLMVAVGVYGARSEARTSFPSDVEIPQEEASRRRGAQP